MWPFGNGGGGTQAYTLPLFPLRTVLFPGGLLPLKVFEQRYVDMTKACLKNNRPFGVCLIVHGDEVAHRQQRVARDRDRRHARAHHRLGRASGGHPAPRDGRRDALPGAQSTDAAERPRASARSRRSSASPNSRSPTNSPLAQLLELIATRVGPRNFPAERNFDDASWVGYRLAELLPLPLSIKQSMLEINDADVRLKVLSKFLSQQGLI